MMNLRKDCFYLILVVALFTFFTGNKNAAAEQPKEAKKEYIVPVLTTAALMGEIKETLKFNGTVYSMSSVNVSSKTAGQVTRIFHDEGDAVKAGDVLLKIDDKTISLRLKQAKAGVTAAKEIYNKTNSAIRLEEEQIDLQIELAASNLEAAKALYEKANAGARPEEKRQAEANMLSAKAAMKTADADHKRMKALFEKKTVSRQQYDLAKMQYDVAKAQHEIAKESYNLVQAGLRDEDKKAAEANFNSATTTLKIAESLKLKIEIMRNDVAASLANLKQAEYEKKIADIMLGDTYVRAPMDGVISKKFIETGEIIQGPGVPLFIVLDQKSVKVKVNIPEISIAKIAEGLEALVESDSYPDKSFKGVITKLSATVNERLRTLEVEIILPNDDGLLREGMFAKIRIYTAIQKDVVYVPVSAIGEKDGEKFVFVARGASPIKRVVNTGIIEDGNIEIISGVLKGEAVIYQGNNQLAEGMTIRIENE